MVFRFLGFFVGLGADLLLLVFVPGDLLAILLGTAFAERLEQVKALL